MHSVPKEDAIKIAPTEGIYFLVRYPSRWYLLSDPFADGADNDHYKWWEEAVADLVAAQWAKTLQRSTKDVLQDIRLLTYAFPRGRVSCVRKRYLVLHGADITPAMKVSKKIIEQSFGIAGICSWHLDEHEHCQADDKEQMRDILRIREDWDGV